MSSIGIQVGAIPLAHSQCRFTVWAPFLQSLSVQLWDPRGQDVDREIPLQPRPLGYWEAVVDAVPPGTLYTFRLNQDLVRPDPAARYQPEGVHGRSQVIDHRTYPWQDHAWPNIPLESYICYELHVGTFTPEGTFEAIIPRLADLADLGINALEIMPVSQFPGDEKAQGPQAYRNWGYDGVYPYAVQNSYGGVEGLKRLVDACHRQGIAVILDVVYNHFGPEGNYMADFAPYFTERYKTPWGGAINFDDAYSNGVHQYFLENALYWLREFHIDALRLDAIHAIYDFGAQPFLARVAAAVETFAQSQGRPYYLIAESDLNDSKVLRPRTQGGFQMDAQWCDDFHHCVHTLLTGETQGYYQDFGRMDQLAQAWQSSFVYSGQYSPVRKRYHGNDVSDRPASQFVIYAQNHDQIGNRMLGERLSHIVSFEALKLAAASVLLAPGIPMLFMGEEYGEEAPFFYFVSHADPALVQAVREGRQQEFAAFHRAGEPPDAAAPDTFTRSLLRWDTRTQGHHQVLLNYHRHLIGLRRSLSPLQNFDRDALEVRFDEEHRWLSVHRFHGQDAVLLAMNWNSTPVTIPQVSRFPGQKHLDSADPAWKGPGSQLPECLSPGAALSLQPHSVGLYLLQP
ncbi:malto-oligosyltrehalose trehalohydrolase [Lyngbya confervoides]|uniref:Malto-oligosyltrehalose trehalohydrolase n=1 Tax=Lyngbya confervoides BDU141951 TaxID=1574623 RepID=A0ABD4T235_9CYAN|nr:malto-oligosyltrehalose trehalohydrolase [Lyngbya confervoides]MCM1982594.1 malto-oligosyltrehalose trehalohydrolase [Lyngbya confervoides BDU141951]